MLEYNTFEGAHPSIFGAGVGTHNNAGTSVWRLCATVVDGEDLRG